MRRAAKVDEGQNDIILALRQMGVSVQPLHTQGGGVPDLLCGFRGRNLLLELKNPNQPPNKRNLTPDQIRWHREWSGQVAVVETVEEAITTIQRYLEAA